MQVEYRQTLKNNIIKFIIWSILLCCSWFYMSYSRAELISVTSTFNILAEKVQISWTKIIGNDWKTVWEKQKILREYESLLATVEKAHCFTSSEIQDLKTIINKLKNTSNTDFKETEYEYLVQWSKYMQKLKDECFD